MQPSVSVCGHVTSRFSSPMNVATKRSKYPVWKMCVCFPACLYVCGDYIECMLFSWVSSHKLMDWRPQFPIRMNMSVCLSMCVIHGPVTYPACVRVFWLFSIPPWPKEDRGWINKWLINGKYNNFTIFCSAFQGGAMLFFKTCTGDFMQQVWHQP